MAVDFTEFEKQDKESWSIAAEKALKGKPIEDLIWKVDDSISIGPFYTKGKSEKETILSDPRKDNQWLIGESFNGDEPSQANDQLLKALAFGLDSPLFFDVEAFDICLENVRVDFLFPIFRGGRIEQYIDWAKKQDLDNSALEGGFIAYEAGFDSINIDNSIAELKTICHALPRYFHSLISFAIDPDHLGNSIGRHLVQLSELIFQLQSNDIPVKIICEIETNNDFIKSVATIRALRLMIAQICSAYDIAFDNILLDVYVDQTAQDIQLGMIGASTQAIAAVTAGVDRLTINCEALAVQQDQEVTRRMTRNVHYLMKMESGMDKIADPLAGSYSIEHLTKQIAEQSWKVFQKG